MCPIDFENCDCMCHTSEYVKHIAACCCIHQKRPAMCSVCNPPWAEE